MARAQTQCDPDQGTANSQHTPRPVEGVCEVVLSQQLLGCVCVELDQNMRLPRFAAAM